MLNVGVSDATATFDALQERLRVLGIGELGDLCEAHSNVAERGRRWGGTKHPELDLYGAAYNYLDLASFMDVLLSTPWQEPEYVQLFVCEQETFKFTVYEIVDGAWRALRPA